MIDSLRTLPAGRRARWAILAVWLVAAAALGSFQAKLQDATTNDPASFLPASSESTQVLHLLQDRFRNGRTTPALLVWQREDGLTARDRAAIRTTLAGVRGLDLSGALPPTPLEVAPDGRLAASAVPLTVDDIEQIEPAVERLRTTVDDGRPPGLRAWVTGPAGITVDAVQVFGQIDVTLLAATTAIVLVLLLLIYRSPVVAVIPLVVVALAYAVAAGIVYLLVEAAGLVVNGQTTGILIILMFGAGTDYCLLIVSRFREELRRHAAADDAMAAALRHASPAILSSGATVVCAMLVLLLADLRTFRSSGPVLALGVATTMLAGLTLLPALLTIVGRRAFWPFVPREGSRDPEAGRAWRAIGERVAARPAIVGGAAAARTRGRGGRERRRPAGPLARDRGSAAPSSRSRGSGRSPPRCRRARPRRPTSSPPAGAAASTAARLRRVARRRLGPARRDERRRQPRPPAGDARERPLRRRGDRRGLRGFARRRPTRSSAGRRPRRRTPARRRDTTRS